MKNKIAALMSAIIILGSLTTNAQLENVLASPDSTVVLDKVYAGILGATNYDCGNDTTTVYVGFRAGVAAHWDIGKKLTVKTFAAGEYDFVSATSFGLHAIWLQYRPGKKWAIETGKGPTLAAQQHRPHPASAGGQFETWTQAQLPGVAYTLNLKFIPSDKMLFGAGMSVRDNMPEYQVTGTYKRLALTGYYQAATNTACAAMTYDGKWLYSTSFVKTDAIGNFSSLTLSSKQQLYFYTVLGYDTKNKTMVMCANGFYKSFSTKYVKGSLALGYNTVNQQISAYTLISL